MELSNTLLESFRAPKILNANDWANAYARLPPGDSAEGRWTSRRVQEDIMRDCSIGNRRYASGQRVREVVILKAAQVGLTKCLFNVVGYTMAEKPCPIGFYLPSPDSVKSYAGGHFAKWLDAQEALDGIVAKEVSSDGKSSMARKVFTGGILNFLSASLPRDIASHSLRLILCDEYDSFPDKVKNEGFATDLIRNRAKEYSDAVLVFSSTPRGTYEESKTWALYKESDQSRFMVKCPHCGKLQYLDHKQFRVREPYQESGMECIDCNKLMLEHHKSEMLRNGHWRPNPKAQGRPGVRGYYLPAFYSTSPTVSWPAIARMRDDAGFDKEKLTAFINTTVGLPASSARESDLKPHEIIAAAKGSDYTTAQDPRTDRIDNSISLITVGCDLQSSKTKGRLEISVWGFSRTHDFLLNNYVIEGDPASDSLWDGLEAATNVTYVSADGKKHVRPHYVFIDCGDGKMTSRVYTVCRSHYTWHPVRGHSIVNKPVVARNNVPLNDSNKLHQVYYAVQVSLAKDLFMDELRKYTDGDPDCRLRLPEDIDVETANSFCSEHRTIKAGTPPKVLWVHYDKGIPNHMWDSSIYARAAKSALVDMYEPAVIWRKLDDDCRVKGQKKSSTGSLYRSRSGGSSWY